MNMNSKTYLCFKFHGAIKSFTVTTSRHFLGSGATTKKRLTEF